MILEIVLLIVGLVLLIAGSEYFVKSSVHIAKKLGVSEFVIGLTLVAIGTNIPELANSIIASVSNQSGILFGGIIGSNISDMSLVIGIASLFAIVHIRKEMIKRDGYIMFFSMILVLLFILDGKISLIESLVLLLMYLTYVLFLFNFKVKTLKKENFRDFLDYFLKFKYLNSLEKDIVIIEKDLKQGRTKRRNLHVIKDMIILLIAGFAIFVGANYVVKETVFFTNYFNVATTFSGLILGVITTLPELSVAVIAAKKKLGSLVVGDIVGSNITKIFLILGISGIINPIEISLSSIYIVIGMLVFGLLFLLFLATKRRFEKKEGIILILLYILFLVGLFVI